MCKEPRVNLSLCAILVFWIGGHTQCADIRIRDLDAAEAENAEIQGHGYGKDGHKHQAQAKMGESEIGRPSAVWRGAMRLL